MKFLNFPLKVKPLEVWRVLNRVIMQLYNVLCKYACIIYVHVECLWRVAGFRHD